MNHIIDAATATVDTFEQPVAPDWFVRLCAAPAGHLTVVNARRATRPVQACINQVLYRRRLGPHPIPLTVSIEVQP